MKFLIFAAVFFVAYFVGAFGFCQIIGTLKYFKRFSLVSALLIIIIWSAILSALAFAVLLWFDKYLIALYVGYGISFILSFRTKPD